MHPSFKIGTGIALWLTLTACGSLSTKTATATSDEQIFVVPSATDHSLNVRSEADHLFILGDVYSKEGRSAEAIKAFEGVLALDPTASAVHLRLSAEYLKNDRMAKTLFHAEQATQLDPGNIEAHLVLGGLYSMEKLYDKALGEYRKVLQLQPQNEEAPLYIGSLYADQKDYKKAERYFRSLLSNKNYQTPHLVHYYIGLNHLDQKGPRHQMAAEKAFRKSLELKPDFADALMSLANLYLQQNHLQQALSLCLNYQKQAGFDPDVAELIFQIHFENSDTKKAYEQLELIADNTGSSLENQMKMALILIEQKELHQAAVKLKEIASKYPDSDAARYYLAAIYEETGQTESAIREYMLVPPTSAHFSKAVVHAARLLKGLGEINKALDVIDSGLKKKAYQPQVYTMYASLLDAKSDYLGAARVLEEGLAKFSKNATLLFQHALMLDRLGKKDVMIAQMKALLTLEPNHVQSLSYLAFTLAELNQNLPEAEKLARRALELEPADGYVLDTLGWVLFKQKKFAESIKVLEKAHEYQSSASIIAEHLADAYSMQSMKEEAKAMYLKAATLAGDVSKANVIHDKLQRLASP